MICQVNLYSYINHSEQWHLLLLIWDFKKSNGISATLHIIVGGANHEHNPFTPNCNGSTFS
jgi:hypothetical protein